MEPYTYTVHSAIGAGKLNKLLPKEPTYAIAVKKGEKQRCILLDTFENELQQETFLLLQVGTNLLLVDLKTGQISKQPGRNNWRFADELEDGIVTSTLKSISKLRAYLPVAELSFRVDLGLLLDDEDKTRARFKNLILYSRDKTVTVGATQYLRGYDRAHADLIEVLERSGGMSVVDSPDLYISLCIKREIYTPKPRIPIKSSASAKDSATTIIKSFITVARTNEAGIIADIDTEFLHDYRVSFRKVRSVLSLFKSVFSTEMTQQLKSEFADIMQSTNRLRDLDVYLLERENYFDLIPQSSHEGLKSLFEYLQKQRKNEHKRVTKNLKTKAYKNRVDTLENLFSKGKHLKAGPKGKQASKAFGARLILKRYNQVCKIAHTIDANTEDEIVHQLRISCKKLRYLMEFFTPLFAQNEIKSLIKPLKILQDNLGNFNDYSVQQDFLRHILRTDLAAFGEKEIEVTESIGALTAMLFRLQRKERKQVMKNFSRFDSYETRTLFKQLFKDIEDN